MTEQRIFKFPLEITDKQNIQIPKGSEILTVQTQDGMPCLWALVDQKRETEPRNIEIYGTGHPVLSDLGTSRKYIATFQMRGGSLVFHVFEYTGV